jgi:hypothetical protein
MRFFPLFAGLIFCLAPASAWTQELHCNPCGHAFGQVQIGSSSSQSFQIINTGYRTVRINSISAPGSPFSLASFPLPAKILSGASLQLTVIFTPTAKGYVSGTFALSSNDPHSPLRIHVQGSGVPSNNPQPQLGVAPATLNFGNVTVGTSASLQATLTASNAAVTISSDGSTSSEFAILGLNLPVTVPAGQSVPVTIQFSPNASGAASGKAGFTSNAVNSPTVEQLAGTGVAQGSHSVSLSWSPGDGNAVGYNVYRGTTNGGPYQEINTALDSSTNYTDSTVAAGATYYYATTEVNAEGEESGYSNVVQAVIPSP